MKNIKRIISAALCTATLATSFSFMPTASAASQNAMNLVRSMGRGYNLGNQFDSTNEWDSNLDPNKIETAWGNPKITQATVNAIKNNGFNTVRIPVTWGQMLNGDTIRGDYLARVKEVVDYAYNQGMYVIIDVHHDGNKDKPSAYWLSGSGSQGRFINIWKQIGNYFASYGDHLVFEDMNEVKFGGSDDSKYTQQGYNELNQMNAAFVSAVRSLGGNNANRLLVIAGANDKIDWTCNSAYQVPNDNMVAVAMHFYDPTNFTVCTTKTQNQYWQNRNTWGSGDDYNELNNKFNEVKSSFTSKNIPVLFTEYGALYNGNQGSKDSNSVYNYLRTVSDTSLQNGICACLWDSGNGGDMRYFNRSSNSWYDSNIGGIYGGSSSVSDFEIVGPQSFGDVNGDGTVDSTDATCILIDYANALLDKKTKIEAQYGDLNKDGSVDSSDATLILIYYASYLLDNNAKLTDFTK